MICLLFQDDLCLQDDLTPVTNPGKAVFQAFRFSDDSNLVASYCLKKLKSCHGQLEQKPKIWGRLLEAWLALIVG